MKMTALIMAGGRGERFWPKSRKTMPKQFLSLTGDGKSMIQLTVERILPIVNIEDIFISTNKDYKSLVLEQLPNIPKENILCEPYSRNTAPCIGLGAIHISKKYDDAIMMVLPSDHLIKYSSMFINTLKDASEIAQKNSNLITIGITPDYPETGYGYIKFNPSMYEGRSFQVDRFVEKPNLEFAKEYIASEEYLWNSGMFVWKVSSILSKMNEFMPDTYQGLLKIREAIGTETEEVVLEKEFREFQSISIDYGIMEKSQNIYTLPGTFGWDDVGSWLAVERIKKTNEYGNVVDGNVITIDSKDCIIEGGNKLIATVGIENLIIVDTEDATLICQKDSAGDIKKVLENLKICNRNEYI
ncbi:mannose-1-phosphate guanylyltransferase [Anaerocolumna aminovalerica]|uniref:mannose-1-phosphate guanylyltransferase n=1 Tax=Anaerocolumna aminovalerica TaxID=1527 RepID=A0A1I5EF61_9FIRM|nr:mannose-1-phosphate guanylyltransferase [Anaerocolumna aminovalerica]SFO10144.1 mannose-1-phosphate guanylyltransferase [Anaerocolumna aminovalerica]